MDKGEQQILDSVRIVIHAARGDEKHFRILAMDSIRWVSFQVSEHCDVKGHTRESYIHGVVMGVLMLYFAHGGDWEKMLKELDETSD